MHSKGHSHHSEFRVSWDPANAAIIILLALFFLIFLFLFLSLTAQPAQGKTSCTMAGLDEFNEARCALALIT